VTIEGDTKEYAHDKGAAYLAALKQNQCPEDLKKKYETSGL
jgi:hypothetical protein